MVTAYLGVGGNIGEREKYLREAVRRLAGLPSLQLTGISSVYETEPVGHLDQPAFLNLVVRVETEVKPRELLALCQGLENALGRVREERWGPRVIDIDILLYGRLRVVEPDLVIPHPEMPVRAFVLVPLGELEPGVRGPADELVVADLARLDASGVRCYPQLDLRDLLERRED